MDWGINKKKFNYFLSFVGGKREFSIAHGHLGGLRGLYADGLSGFMSTGSFYFLNLA